MSWRSKLARGFTLIEMAIVLVVIGLVLSGGLVAVAPVLQNSKFADTNAKLDRIEQALVLHTIRYGCLPCPADGNLASANANAGRGNAGAYYVSGCQAAACTNAQGVVPWINLGLSENDAVDGYGGRIDYALTPTLQNISGLVRTPPSTYPAGALRVDNRAGFEQTGGAGNRAAYVLVSHGPNRSTAFLSTGFQIGNSAGSAAELANSTINTTGPNAAVQDQPFTPAGAGTNYYDDIVRFRTAPLLIQLCGSNACGNPA
jgi:prepilin-type N-terminal cleavage/methylation domain-containing protein